MMIEIHIPTRWKSNPIVTHRSLLLWKREENLVEGWTILVEKWSLYHPLGLLLLLEITQKKLLFQ